MNIVSHGIMIHRRILGIVLCNLFFVCWIVVLKSQPTTSPTSQRSSSNYISVVAGTGTNGDSAAGSFATATNMNKPRGLWMDSLLNVYWSEFDGCCIRKFSESGKIVFNYMGNCGTNTFSGENIAATSASSSRIGALFGNTAGVVYFADYGSNRVRTVSASGIVSTILGTGTASNTGDGGVVSSATILTPLGIALDTSNRIFVTSNSGFVVRLISSNIITLYAG